mmetsp:Transcript_8135/g.25561  ORF Transcript_8135/g.25561 Transcript_8135/m.25561 type:complete len:206 (+) Transcript_8135:2153-2770(+)
MPMPVSVTVSRRSAFDERQVRVDGDAPSLSSPSLPSLSDPLREQLALTLARGSTWATRDCDPDGDCPACRPRPRPRSRPRKAQRWMSPPHTSPFMPSTISTVSSSPRSMTRLVPPLPLPLLPCMWCGWVRIVCNESGGSTSSQRKTMEPSCVHLEALYSRLSSARRRERTGTELQSCTASLRGKTAVLAEAGARWEDPTLSEGLD